MSEIFCMNSFTLAFIFMIAVLLGFVVGNLVAKLEMKKKNETN